MIDILPVLGSQDLFPEWYADPAIDDALGWLADALVDEDVVGTFLFQSARAEQLERHGRRDAIQQVARHDVGLHGRDQHPIDAEVVEHLEWHESVRALARIEDAEMRSLERIFGKPPVGSSQHGPTFVPQLYAVAREAGRPFLFGYPAAPPLHTVSWYVGALSIPYETPVEGFMAFDGVYDHVLPDDRAFGPALERLLEHVRRCRAAGQPFLSIFICHPERLVYPEPVARRQYADGINRPAPNRAAIGQPARRGDAEIARALANFRALLRAVRDLPGARFVRVADAVSRFGREPDELTRADLAAIAARAVAAREIALGGPISPAEALVGWATGLVVWRSVGQLPNTVERQSPFGPLEMPRAVSDRGAVSSDEAVALARLLLVRLGSRSAPYLPANLTLGDATFGLGAIYAALAGAYLATHDGIHDGPFRIHDFPRVPHFAHALAAAARKVENSPMVRPGLGTDRIALHTNLQTWTLKTATQ